MTLWALWNGEITLAKMFYRDNKIESIWKQTEQFSQWGSQTEDEQTDSHICNKEKGKTKQEEEEEIGKCLICSWKTTGDQRLLIVISVINKVKVGIWRWTHSLLSRGNTPLPYLFTPSSLPLSVRIHPSFLHPLSTFCPLPLHLSLYNNANCLVVFLVLKLQFLFSPWNPAPQTNHK